MPKRSSASSHPLTNHEQIRAWAEERGARPTCVRGTGGGEDVGMIRLDFPGYSGEDSLEEISWDDWFQKFDENNLALLVQETTANGQQSNFNKLVSRETAEEREQETGARSSRSRGRSGTGRQSSRAARSQKSRSGRSARMESGASSVRKSSRTSRSSQGKSRTRASSTRATGKKQASATSGRKSSSRKQSRSTGRGEGRRAA